MVTKKEKQREVVLTHAYDDYAKGMNSYSFFKTHNQATSDNLVQDTFMKTWQYLVKGGDIILMKAFLYHTLNHLIIDDYRKHKTVSLDALMEKGYAPSIDLSEKTIDMFDGKEAVLLIENLPSKYRKIIHLRYIKNLSLTEIALITKQSKNAVSVQSYRGLAMLKILYNRKP